jgi:hypothetical protein
MGKGGKHSKNPDTPAKRGRSDDEISPNSRQEHKSIKMSISEDELKGLITNVAVMMKTLETIKTSQDNFTAAFMKMDTRMTDLETKVDQIKVACETDDLREQIHMLQRENSTLKQSAKQSEVNNIAIIRNLPLEIVGDDESTSKIIQSVLRTLNVSSVYFEAEAYKARDKKTANITVTFTSAQSKSKVFQKFRKLKNDKVNGSSLLVEKHVNLANEHFLNGKMIMIANKLTKFNADLVKKARDYVPSHFDYVFDSYDGTIKAKIGDKFSTIHDEDDIKQLVEEIEKYRPAKRNQNHRGSPITTRSTKTGGRGG